VTKAIKHADDIRTYSPFQCKPAFTGDRPVKPDKVMMVADAGLIMIPNVQLTLSSKAIYTGLIPYAAKLMVSPIMTVVTIG